MRLIQAAIHLISLHSLSSLVTKSVQVRTYGLKTSDLSLQCGATGNTGGFSSVVSGVPTIPPDDTDEDRSRGDRENGIRRLTVSESQRAAVEWERRASSRMISGSSGIESYEMLTRLREICQLMTNARIQRIELLVFGLFEDGSVVCAAGVRWKKKIFPAEMEVLSLYLPNPSTGKGRDASYAAQMMDFISALCRDNAILADFSPLSGFDTFRLNPSCEAFLPANAQAVETVQSPLVYLYMRLNRSPSLCLGDIALRGASIGHYWYKTSVQSSVGAVVDPKTQCITQLMDCATEGAKSEILIYFRQKKGSEFEIRFRKPEVGTQQGSGTVGNPLILSLLREDINSILPSDSGTYLAYGGSTSAMNGRGDVWVKASPLLLPKNIQKSGETILQVAEAIKRSIRHPDLSTPID